jgi:ecotin
MDFKSANTQREINPVKIKAKSLLRTLAIGLSLGVLASAPAADNMKAFPPAEKGMVRHVLQLPKQDDESAFKVELLAGKTVQVDEGNRYFFGGKIEMETIKGWGFPRYNVSKLGPMAGTRMAINPDAPKVNRFVTLGREPFLIRYNSRLPIVVYAPDGVEVRYRLWSAGPEAKVIEEG